MKRKLTITACCLIAGILPVLLLNDYSHSSLYQQQFLRKFQPHVLTGDREMNIAVNSYYLAGCSESSFFLGNYTASAHLLSLNYKLDDSVHFRITFPDSIKKIVAGTSLKIATPYLFCTGGSPSVFFIADLNTLQMKKANWHNPDFEMFQPISSSSFVARMYNPSLKQNILVKYSNGSILATYTLEKQFDGILCTDGRLLYDPITSSVVYFYYYRNQFLRLDTNLSIVYKGRTIDTNTIAKIKIASIKSENTTTFGAPPLMVNRMGCVSQGSLFINSTLAAQKEDKNVFHNNFVIDVYALSDGHYKYSFYIPRSGKPSLQDFGIYKNKLISLTGNWVSTFDLKL